MGEGGEGKGGGGGIVIAGQWVGGRKGNGMNRGETGMPGEVRDIDEGDEGFIGVVFGAHQWDRGEGDRKSVV